MMLFIVSSAYAYDVYFYHNNHLGSPATVTNLDGLPVWKADYDPFGETINEEGDSKIKYNSKEEDQTGLLYYGSRYYNPKTGRFITADTVKGDILDTQSQNLYVYVQNNPMMYIDPTGNQLIAAAGAYATAASQDPTLIIDMEDFANAWDQVDFSEGFTASNIEAGVIMGLSGAGAIWAFGSIPGKGKVAKGIMKLFGVGGEKKALKKMTELVGNLNPGQKGGDWTDVSNFKGNIKLVRGVNPEAVKSTGKNVLMNPTSKQWGNSPSWANNAGGTSVETHSWWVVDTPAGREYASYYGDALIQTDLKTVQKHVKNTIQRDAHLSGAKTIIQASKTRHAGIPVMTAPHYLEEAMKVTILK